MRRILFTVLFMAGCATGGGLDRYPATMADRWLDKPIEIVIAYMGEPTAVLGTRYIWERHRERSYFASTEIVCRNGHKCRIEDRGGFARYLASGGNYRCVVVVTVHLQTETVKAVDIENSRDDRCAAVWRKP